MIIEIYIHLEALLIVIEMQPMFHLGQSETAAGMACSSNLSRLNWLFKYLIPLSYLPVTGNDLG